MQVQLLDGFSPHPLAELTRLALHLLRTVVPARLHHWKEARNLAATPVRTKGEGGMTEAEKRFWSLRDQYLSAQISYNLLARTDDPETENVLWTHLKAVQAQLRQAQIDVLKERGLMAS